jgi:2-methylisocitrate lyase-like PEP mutase family enzyme
MTVTSGIRQPRRRATDTVRAVTSRADNAAAFLALHVPGRPLVMPNPWDVGSAKLLAALGYQALATTSSGYAGTLGRLDYGVTRAEALAHAATLAAAVEVPVSADLENGFADDPAGVSATVTDAVAAGLAGCSVEDFTGDREDPIYGFGLAVERVEAAAKAAHGRAGLVLTARAENYLHGLRDLSATIARLKAFEEAGADVLYAPGLSDIDEIRAVVSAVTRPVNVLLLPGGPTIPELAAAGVAWVSVGGAFSAVALGALARAGRELLTDGTCGWMELAGEGRKIAAAAFG